ncbi:MAG: GNAT family N-acetyltransferase [Sinobacteraceae bacterium]|nr:GNAT family N-acetyltransferase [Nevskiaceae bacterium]
MPSQKSETIIIRPYDGADALALSDLFQASVRSIASRDYSVAQLRAWAPDVIDPTAFDRRCRSKSTWVAEVQQRIAGFADLGHAGLVDMLYVHPSLERRGVARALLEQVELAARQLGESRLYTEASITAWPVFASRASASLRPRRSCCEASHDQLPDAEGPRPT